MKGIEHDGKRILVVNLEGTVYAWDGTCTHEEYDLSMGFLTGDSVTCALHLSRFNLLTGEAVNPPAEKPLGKHQVKRSEEHTSELQSPYDLVCRLLLEKKKKINASEH